MSDHAILAPSGRWPYCAGSIKLEAAFSDTDSTAAKEGTAAHWVAEDWLRGLEEQKPGYNLDITYVGLKAPNGVVITQEMQDHIKKFVHKVWSFVNEPGTNRELWIEHRVDISVVHPKCWGTLDVGIYDFNTQHVTIMDLKYGWGIVEPGDQGHLYGLGFADELNKRSRSVKSISIGIYQPRPYHPEGPMRYKNYASFADMIPVWQRLKTQAEEAMSDNPKVTPGDHCKHCKAKHVCPALANGSYDAFEFAESAQPIEINNEQLSMELTALNKYKQIIENRLQALESYGLELINEGKQIPGYHKGYGRGSRDWAIDEQELIALGEAIGIDLAPRKPLTVNQAEQAGLPKEITKDKKLVNQQQGKVKLLPGDPSELAKKVFNK